MKRTLLQLWVTGLVALLPVTLHAQKVAPKADTAPSPGYPEELTDSGLNGQAEVDFIVKADGSVGDAQLGMATHRAFGRAALAVIKNWHFQPGTHDGAPVDTRVSIPFKFAAPFEQTINHRAQRKVFVALSEPAVSEKDFPAKKLKVKQPARPMLPRALAASGVEEKVLVKFVVSPQGKPLNPTVAAPAKHKELEPAAIEAVALMGFEPPVKDGKPVYVETTYPVEFRQERRGGGGGGGDGGFGGGGFGGGGGMRGGGGGGGGTDD